MFKRIICLLTTACLLAIGFSCLVSAETGWTAVFKVEQTAAESAEGNVSVRVSVSGITSETGIICAIYKLHYDPKCLELTSWKNGTPSNWDFSESSTLCAEDWSQVINEDGETYFYYTLLNVAAQDGVKNDGVLYTDLQFKVLDSSADSTDIKITDISFVDVEDLANGTSLDLADKTLSLELTGTGSGDVSDDTSSESSSESSEGDTGNTASEPSTEVSVDGGSNVVTVDITLNGIKDPAGVASLLFRVKYDENKLNYVSYECIKPSNWREDTIDFENLTPADQINGNLSFWMLNADENCGVTDDGALGFRITFEVKGGTFDPSWLTIDEAEVINAQLQEMDSESYSFSIVKVGDDSSATTDPVSDGNSTLIIVIVVVAAVLVIGGGVAVWYFVRKKKN